jgi:hypothetical protein
MTSDRAPAPLRRAAILLLVLLAAMSAAVAEAADPQFRNSRWGMTRDEVFRSEPAKGLPIQSSDPSVMLFGTEVFGHSSLVIYRFTGGKLVGGGYIILVKSSDANPFLRTFYAVAERMAAAYGPAEVARQWAEGEQQKDGGQESDATIAAGRLKLKATWRLPFTSIRMLLENKRNEPGLSVYYDAAMPDMVPDPGAKG